ncbi:MAG: hypothetical protein ABIQ59_17410 [Nocardioidaceae bacterium]
MTTTRYPFAFAPAYRLPALVFAITPATAWVELGPSELTVRFGPWRLRSALVNVTSVSQSGGYGYLKTAGPAHLSLSDRGVTFATNGAAGVCVEFGRPVAGIDPTRRILHPGATMTVRDPAAFAEDLRARIAGGNGRRD